MSPSKIFFWSAIGFMVGTIPASSVIGSFVNESLVITLIGLMGLIAGVIWALLAKPSPKRRTFLMLVILFWCFFLAGAFYFGFYTANQEDINSFLERRFFTAVFDALTAVKYRIESNIEAVLSPQKAAFMNGLILGERQKFSNEFREALNKSGTTHLVALSGYNISIIIWALAGFLGGFFSRRNVFVITILVIVAFVIATGGAASVVRAAIMAGLVLLAERAERPYDAKIALVAAAFFMTVANPQVVALDWGFQLSFAAVLGLMYIRPRLQKIFGSEPGFLGWRDNFTTTTSAQAAVLPLLIWHFGYVSPFSLIANVLVLEVIPMTMAVGFLIGALGFVSYHLSLITGWAASILLGYEIFVIEIFAKLSLLIS